MNGRYYINCRFDWDATKGKFNKVPCDAQGKNINHLDPSQWMTYSEARARQTENIGTAVVLNGDGRFCIDIDDALLPDKTWDSAAQAMYLSFSGALGEVSVSGKGLHVFGRCDPAQLKDRKNKWEGKYEFYTDGRFIALSADGPKPIGDVERDVDWTQQLLKIVPQREFLGDLPDGRDPAYTGPENDDELIALMLRSKGSTAATFGLGVKVHDLWTANPEVLGKHYPGFSDDQPFDHSSADAALMSHLAWWTGKDMPRMDRLFRRSALMREKYEKRADYRRSTIENAARLCKSVYDKPRSNTLANTTLMPGAEIEVLATASGFMDINAQIEYFKDITYVADIHKMLMPDGMLMTPERFSAYMGGYEFQMTVDNKKSTRKAFEAFTENQIHKFPKAKSTCFYPDREPLGIMDDGKVNVWVPPKIVRAPGDIEPFMDLMRKLFPDANDLQIMLDWMRDMVQNPGKKMLWAPVIQGTQGNGKSIIGEILSYAVGPNFVHKPKATRLGEKHDGWYQYKLLIVVDEFYGKDRFNMLEGLKPMITDYWVGVRDMAVSERLTYTPANWLFTTNHRDAVRKDVQDRRYCMFITPHQNKMQRDADFPPGEYFPALYDWLRGGGFAAVADWLWTSKAEKYGPISQQQTVAPDTSTTAEVMENTQDPIQAEIMEAIDEGKVGFKGGWLSSYWLNKLLDEKHYRIPPPRRKQILEDMGFVNRGRIGRHVEYEENGRPIIWCVPALAQTQLTQYLTDQGYPV